LLFLLIAAIRFVLGDQFGNLRVDNRQHLLHDANGKQMMQASVEITLDNKDGRILVEGDQIKVGRTIGLKKDEYFLNSKAVKKQDITSILESAGFSKSNPFYIVAQGQVTNLVAMSNKDRLELIKGVAGTHVYEERRTTSLAILLEAEAKRNEITLVIDGIEKRLSELDRERAELQEYQTLDKKRRAIEYVIYKAQLNKAQEELDSIQSTVSANADNLASMNENRDKVSNLQTQLKDLEVVIKNLQTTLRSLDNEKQSISASIPSLTSKRTKLSSKVKDLESRIENDAEHVAKLRKEMAAVETRISNTKKQLEDFDSSTVKTLQAEFDALTSQKVELEASANQIYEKQSRSNKFRTKKERDAHLMKIIKELKTERDGKEAEITKIKNEIKANSSKLEKLKSALVAQEKELFKSRESLSSMESSVSSSMNDIENRRTEAFNARQEAWKTIANCDAQITELIEKEQAADRDLHSFSPLAVRKGLEYVRQLQDSSNPSESQGIFGQIIDLVRPRHPRYNVAVDVVAGQQLFNVVVQDEEVASRVIDSLNKHKKGRVTLMPLKQLSKLNVTYPDDPDVRPLINFLEFEQDQCVPAIESIFGKVLLCKSIQVASKYAKSNSDFTCVTLDGDVIRPKGGIQGGYIDHSKSKLVSIVELYGARSKREELLKLKDENTKLALEWDQKLNIIRVDESKLNSEKARVRDLTIRLAQDIESNQNETYSLTNLVENQTRQVVDLTSSIANLNTKVSNYELEMSSELSSGALSSSEEASLSGILKKLEEISPKVLQSSMKLSEAKNEKLKLQSLLEDNLLKMLSDIKSQLHVEFGGTSKTVAEDQLQTFKAELHSSKSELASCISMLSNYEQRLVSIDTELSKNKKEMVEKQDASNKLVHEIQSLNELIETESSLNEKMNEKKRIAMRKRDECIIKLRDIGTLPSNEIAQIESSRKKDLLSELTKVNEGLKKYSHVNKKAIEQFTSFSEQREQLHARMEELNQSDASIRDLIKSLDAKKDEAIIRTFKTVQAHFKDIFRELVPKGSATMSIITTADDPTGEGLDELGEPLETDAKSKSKSTSSKRNKHESVETFSGLKISASFTDNDEVENTSQLSGGQKSLIAAAIIFAIQRTDPAPFYILDEIDSALDPTHRSAVATLISKQSHNVENPCQIISTSFSPELLAVGDKFIAVTMQHKVSFVLTQTKEEAIAFVKSLAKEETDQLAGSGTSNARAQVSSSLSSMNATSESAETEVGNKKSRKQSASN
jgi:structural maintenance of chromosome 3 (chondroitin sulfate proteoglycan 6)